MRSYDIARYELGEVNVIVLGLDDMEVDIVYDCVDMHCFINVDYVHSEGINALRS
jgi:hypothetical protein